MQARLVEAAGKMARALAIRGPFNVQFLVKGDEFQIIELNLRASRSLPFLTKATGVPLLREAARAMLGRPLSRSGVAPLPPDRWGVKVPQFSFLQLAGSDPLLGVEMQSTGEVACFGPTFADALVKALVATGVKLVPSGGTAFLSVGGVRLKEQLLPTALALRTLGYKLAATEDTAAFLSARGAKPVQVLHKVSEPDRKPNVVEALDSGKIDLMLNLPSSLTQAKLEQMLEDEYVLRRRAVELGIPLFTSLEGFAAYVEGLAWLKDHPVDRRCALRRTGTWSHRRERADAAGGAADPAARPATARGQATESAGRHRPVARSETRSGRARGSGDEPPRGPPHLLLGETRSPRGSTAPPGGSGAQPRARGRPVRVAPSGAHREHRTPHRPPASLGVLRDPSRVDHRASDLSRGQVRLNRDSIPRLYTQLEYRPPSPRLDGRPGRE